MLELQAVAQRQGAVVPKSPWLPTGCQALADLAGRVLGLDVRRVPVRAGTSTLVGGIHNREVLLANRGFQAQSLRHASGPVLTIGGDCGVETVPLGFARKRFGPALGVLWFDAHGDLNTPATSPSGAYHGMALRHAFGEGDRDFVLDTPVVSRRVVLAGARTLDPGEQAMVDRGLVRHVPIERGYDTSWVLDAVIASRAPQFYLHIDLDVLDPSEFADVTCPVPGGLLISELVDAIRAVAAIRPIIGAGITECATDDPDRLAVLAPILRAVGAALHAHSTTLPAQPASSLPYPVRQ
ncbi:arginase family protein [Kutzneria sp. CA-103260]|uniref:arginase family protein n=1 Tax=Kutzneria sp. CA-103260 TaxID=2802641 RepID=UPI001BEF5FBE|nr:arginase family protein [Kutzneria sp. CA-103260]QUQ71446.1 arginase [Kutzneria sp. CA-103260]